MRMAAARVQGYRCIGDLSVDFDEQTALIGSGGVGKSAFLRALEWFFDDTTLQEEDLHLPHGEDPKRVEQMVVTVTFDSLGGADRETLGRYGGKQSTTFTRAGRPGEPSKLSGQALSFPDFDPIRAHSDGRRRKSAFAQFAAARGRELGFPDLLPTRIAEVDLFMEEFERANPALCEFVDADASHLFGWRGGPTLRDRFDYVLVGAALDASEAMGGGRNSALTRLLADIGELDQQTESEIAELQAETEERMRELITSARAADLGRVGEAITEKARELVPAAEVELIDEIPGISPPSPSVLARVREGDGHFTDVGRQGHGLQRALVISVLQALADTEAGITLQQGDAAEPKALMLAIEEPELYQHPLQARALAAALTSLATAPEKERPRSFQVTYSTHSPHFVRPALFEHLRIFRRDAGHWTTQVSGSTEKVLAALKESGLQIRTPLKVQQTLAASLGEAVFAKAVLLCEGVSDAAVLRGVADTQGGFDRHGVAVATCWGKTVLTLAYAILRQLEIPTYVVFDADAGLGERLKRKESLSEAQRAEQVEEAARLNREILAVCGEAEVEWPAREARAASANFADRIEEDLIEIWPGWAPARDALSRELGIKPKSEQCYRQAVAEAGVIPPFFREVVGKVKGLV